MARRRFVAASTNAARKSGEPVVASKHLGGRRRMLPRKGRTYKIDHAVREQGGLGTAIRAWRLEVVLDLQSERQLGLQLSSLINPSSFQSADTPGLLAIGLHAGPAITAADFRELSTSDIRLIDEVARTHAGW